mgnify:CR=1 FL=1
MVTESFRSWSFRSKVLAVLSDRIDYELLSLALELVSPQADIVLVQGAKSAVGHLRQCTASATTCNRRWPDTIVIDTEAMFLDSDSWLAELGALSGRPDSFTPILLLTPGAGVGAANEEACRKFGMQVVLKEGYAATAPDVQGGDYIGPNGIGEMWGSPSKVTSNAHSRDVAVAARLWELSERATNGFFM